MPAPPPAAPVGTSEPAALRGVVAVGASAGGVEALTQFAAGLPRDLPYAVLVVLHLPASSPSVLAQILDRSGPLPAVWARDGEQLKPGTIYVAVPNRHLLVSGDHILLSEGPTENGHRPAINALFRSVALSCGGAGIGVVLSGVLDDGVLGLAAIRSRGGTTIVQMPTDALFPSMPLNALEAGVVDHESTAGDIGQLLARLAERPVRDCGTAPGAELELENRIATGRRFSTEFDADELGPPSGYTCPDCNGSLMEVGLVNYRCRVGHAWTGNALLRARDHEVESALWAAIRSLQEKAKLSRRLADNLGVGTLNDRYNTVASESEHAAAVIGQRLSETYAESPEHHAG